MSSELDEIFLNNNKSDKRMSFVDHARTHKPQSYYFGFLLHNKLSVYIYIYKYNFIINETKWTDWIHSIWIGDVCWLVKRNQTKYHICIEMNKNK